MAIVVAAVVVVVAFIMADRWILGGGATAVVVVYADVAGRQRAGEKGATAIVGVGVSVVAVDRFQVGCVVLPSSVMPLLP